MLYYDSIDVSEGLDISKTSKSKECDMCPYCHFKITVQSFDQSL